ncbi:MAG: DUF1385 domain-containing protein [Lachnospiraceae bacterium]|nr:DUF1385 domain-containing protein [Lachnospiraceae bacterium]
MKQKSSGIGGQAVMEGIMMRHKDKYSIAVRKPDREIEVKVEDYRSVIPLEKLGKLPILRGVYSFVDSLVIGTKCLMYSAQFFEDEEEETVKKELTEEEKLEKEKKDEKAYKAMMTVTMIFSVVLSIGLFVLLPYFAASFLRKVTDSNLLVTTVEAVLRIAIFLLYMVLISRMKDIQRVFMYHGAEHKCINCVEHGMDLNVENVLKSSRLHKRCGTSFLLIVMVVSIIFFFFIRVESPLLRVVIRVLLMPVVAGVAYEFIRLAGKSDNGLVCVLSKPGLALQKMTTKEPTADMVEVAIAAVDAVFDWKAYLEECRSEEA